MTRFRKKGDPRGESYRFRDERCIAAACWAPGTYHHRGATCVGSRNTGCRTLACMTREYRGCPPEAERGYSADNKAARVAEGWKLARGGTR